MIEIAIFETAGLNHIECLFLDVQSQIGSTRVFVRSVAMETLVRKNRANVLVKRKLLSGVGKFLG
jgi:hypothetical protein